MDELKERIQANVLDYFSTIPELANQKPSKMLIGLVIEKYIVARNYPRNWDSNKILEDVEKAECTLSEKVIQLYVRRGGEGELSHSENGTVRHYESLDNMFKNVVAYVDVY